MTKDLFLSQFSVLDQIHITNILPFFEIIHLEKGAFLLQKGEIANKLYFLEEGIVREYSDTVDKNSINFESESKKVTNWIIGSGVWFNQVTSFIKEEPATCYLQALDPVKCYSITKTAFIAMIETFPLLNIQMHKLQEGYLLRMEQRNHLFRIKNLNEKLDYFERVQPELANRVSQNIIASYLNITPSQLSRIRKKRINNTQ